VSSWFNSPWEWGELGHVQGDLGHSHGELGHKMADLGQTCINYPVKENVNNLVSNL